jgi:hypothetical protein
MKAAPIAVLTACIALLAGCAGYSSSVDWLLGRVPPSPPGPKSLSGILDLNSEPQGAQAAVSLGATCQTPCSLEVTAEAPFTVTFSQQGYAPDTVSVKIQPGVQGVSDPKFAPNPVFAQLAPVAPPPKPAAPAKKKPPPKQ